MFGDGKLWIEEKIEITIGSSSKSFYLSEWIRKIDERGLAKCIIMQMFPGLWEIGKNCAYRTLEK
jgi:hypothetical protein